MPAAADPAPPPGDELVTLAGLLFECAAGLERRVDAALRDDVDLPVSSFEVLLRLSRSEGRRVQLLELGRGLAITTGGVTRLIDRLEREGLVRRSRGTTDRRTVYAVLTAKGARRLERALPGHVADLTEAFSTLGPRERAALETTLRRLRGALAR